MILITTGLELTNLEEVFQSLIELKHQPEAAHHSELHYMNMDETSTNLPVGRKYKETISRFREYISQSQHEKYQKAWGKAVAILIWLENNNVDFIYYFPLELPTSILKSNIDLTGLNIKLLKEDYDLPIQTLFLLKAMKDSGVLLDIDSLDEGAASLNIFKQQSVFNQKGSLVGRVSMAQTCEQNGNGANHSIEHVDENMVLLQVNIDDQNPEIIAYVMELLFESGANDVFSQPIVMKKTRSATMLNVLCNRDNVQIMKSILFKETTTFGIRQIPTIVHRLARSIETMETPWGEVNVKIAKQDGRETQRSPEFEDCRKVARMHNIPIKKVYEWVISQFI